VPELPGLTKAGALERRITGDGSPSFFSPTFQEAFHSQAGARQEAEQKFVQPAQLQRWPRGSTIQVVDVGVGLGYNSAALAEAAADLGLTLQWWGLELDSSPLTQALADASFCRQWRPQTLELLRQLTAQKPNPTSAWCCAWGQGQLLWGDARQRLPELLEQAEGQCHLVLLDAFSPRRCPQLWTLEFLTGLARLLAPEGRILTYCSAAAVRQSLRQIGLELAAIQGAEPGPEPWPESGPEPAANPLWSMGTVASWQPLPLGGVLRALSPMEWDHLHTQAAEPYRDPSQTAEAPAILEARRLAQAKSPAPSTSAWRRRWGT